MAQIIFIGTGGGGGGPGTDRFEASVIVGNVLNGDPAVAQAAPFRYIPDPGDGSGIELAISEAAISALPTRIRLRPGTYDISGLAGGYPLSLPTGVSLEGSGIGVTILSMVGNGTDRYILNVPDQTIARDLTILLPNPGVEPIVPPTGDQVVRLVGTGFTKDVEVVIEAGAGTQVNDSLLAGFWLFGDGSRALDVVVDCQMEFGVNGPTLYAYAMGPIQSGPFTQNCVVRGTTRGFAAQVRYAFAQNAQIEVSGECGSAGVLAGARGQVKLTSLIPGIVGSTAPYSLVISGSDMIVDTVINDLGTPVGYIQLSGSRNTVRMNCAGNSVNGDVEVDGLDNNLTGVLSIGRVNMSGDSNGLMNARLPLSSVAVSGNNNIVVGNRVGVAPISNTGTGNEIANNIAGV